MKQRIILFFIAIALTFAHGWALENLSSEINPEQVLLTSTVSQGTTKTVYFAFTVDPVIVGPTDPVATTGSSNSPESGGSNNSLDNFIVSVEGADCDMFSAQITEEQIFNGTCTVLISYLPTTEGSHQATLKVMREGSNESTKTVLLTGVTLNDNRDPHSVHSNGLLDLNEEKLTDDINGDSSGNSLIPFSGLIPVNGDTGPTNTDAVVIVSPSSLDFGETMVGYSATKTFFVKGENLNSSLNLEVMTTRSGGSDEFAIDKTRITAYQAINGVTITVTYTPTSVGAQNSTSIIISGGGAESCTVSLCGTAVEGVLPITVDPASLSFAGVTVGNTETKEFTVSLPASNVTNLLELQAELDDATGMFSISPQSFTALEAANGVKIMVTYQPTEAGSHNASVVINGPGAESKTINLRGATYEEFSTILVTSDDLTMECLIDENSKIKIEKPYLVIKTHDQVLTCDLENMTQVRYGQRVVTGDLGQETLRAGTIIMHGLKENDMIEVANSNGTVVMRKNGNASGNLTLSLENEPSGEYVISTASQTIKIVK